MLTTAKPPPVLAPSPGRARYALLVVVLLLAGAQVGNLMHNQIFIASWKQSQQVCMDILQPLQQPSGGSPQWAVAIVERYQQCAASVEHVRALVILAGAGLLIVLGVLLMQLLPYRLFRRARPVRPASTPWQQRAIDAVRSMGGRAKPVVVFGSFPLREPFTVRFLGRTRIVLPPGVVNLPEAQADAIVRHEAAHVVAGDVGLVWLTRGVWWALPPVLLLPLITVAAQGALADEVTVLDMLVQPFWFEYVGRAGVLLLLALLISLMVLRSREHEADLRSVHGLPAAPLQGLLNRLPDTSVSRWRRWMAIHPSFSLRRAVLDNRELLTHARFPEGAAFGLLAAMSLQATQMVAGPGLQATALAGHSLTLAALLTGVLLALGWGTALWRAVLSARPGTRPGIHRGALLGPPAGFAAGLLLDIWVLGTVLDGPPLGWWVLVTAPLLVAGAGALSVALASRWASRRDTAPTPRWAWLIIAALNIALFTTALWMGQTTATLQKPPANGLHGYILGALQYNYLIPTTLALIGVCTLAWWCSSRRLSLIAIAVLASAAAITGRWLLPSAADLAIPGLTAQLGWWTALAAGTGCLLALLAMHGAAGLGHALAAAPLATLLTAAVVAVFHDPYPWDWETTELYLTRSSALLVLTLLTVALPAALLPTRERSHPRWLPLLLTVGFTTAAIILIMRTSNALLMTA